MYDKYVSQIHAITSTSDSFPLYAPKNGKYILAAFVQATRTGPGLYPADFSDGYVKPANGAAAELPATGGAVTALQYVIFKYQSEIYPKDDYNITNNNTNTLCGTSNSSMELYRLFSELISNSDSRNDRCGTIYDISKIAAEPIFCHKVSTKPNSEDGIMTVAFSLNQTYAKSKSGLLVVCLYGEVVNLAYNDAWLVVFTDLVS